MYRMYETPVEIYRPENTSGSADKPKYWQSQKFCDKTKNKIVSDMKSAENLGNVYFENCNDI